MQFIILAVLAVLPLIRALSITTPNAAQPWIGNSTVQITWTSIAGDPATFSIELSRPNQNLGPYNGALAVASPVVPTTDGQITFELPQVPPGAGYLLQFVNISNINIVYASSQSFSVTENDTVSSTSTTMSSASGSTTGSMTMSMTSSASAASSYVPPLPISHNRLIRNQLVCLEHLLLPLYHPLFLQRRHPTRLPRLATRARHSQRAAQRRSRGRLRPACLSRGATPKEPAVRSASPGWRANGLLAQIFLGRSLLSSLPMHGLSYKD